MNLTFAGNADEVADGVRWNIHRLIKIVMETFV